MGQQCCPCGGCPAPPPGAQLCYPANAPIRRLDPNTGEVTRLSVIDLSIGDFVECVLPPNVTAPVATYSFCQIYYLQMVTQPTTAANGSSLPFYDVSYALANGTVVHVQATDTHLLFVASQTTAPSLSVPRGTDKQMQNVQPGDLVVAHDEVSGFFYTSPVLSVALTTEAGAFSPLLLDAGLPIVFDTLFFAFANTHVDGMGYVGNEWFYLVQAPVWQLAEDSVQNGCLDGNASACVCLDDGVPCFNSGVNTCTIAVPAAAWPASVGSRPSV